MKKELPPSSRLNDKQQMEEHKPIVCIARILKAFSKYLYHTGSWSVRCNFNSSRVGLKRD